MKRVRFCLSIFHRGQGPAHPAAPGARNQLSYSPAAVHGSALSPTGDRSIPRALHTPRGLLKNKIRPFSCPLHLPSPFSSPDSPTAFPSPTGNICGIWQQTESLEKELGVNLPLFVPLGSRLHLAEHWEMQDAPWNSPRTFPSAGAWDKAEESAALVEGKLLFPAQINHRLLLGRHVPKTRHPTRLPFPRK